MVECETASRHSALVVMALGSAYIEVIFIDL
jgi:hypothetical protein